MHISFHLYYFICLVHCQLFAHPRRSYCVVGHLTVLLRRPRGDSTGILSGQRSYGFGLSKHAVTRRSMRPHRIHWRWHCIATALLAFPRRAGRRPGTWERRPRVTATLCKLAYVGESPMACVTISTEDAGA